ncbi:MAG: hypothetical protein U0694_18950 [Anaerolineae bacterium]
MWILQYTREILTRHFLLRWTLANALGWALGLLLALTLGVSLGQWLGMPLLSLILSGTLAGVVVGAFQRLALRGEVTQRWVSMSALGGLIGAFPAFVLSFTLLLRWELGAALMGSAFAAVLAAVQCAARSDRMPPPAAWIVTNAFAGCLCGACSVVAALPILPLICSAGPPLFGLITGLLIVRALRDDS